MVQAAVYDRHYDAKAKAAGVMQFFTPARGIVRDTITTLISINRIVTSIDRVYVTLTWVGSATNSLSQLGLFTLVGGLLGHVVSSIKVDWVTVIAGIALYLGYRLAETVISAALGLRAKSFELALWNLMEERILGKLASLDLGRLLDPSFMELQRLARYRGAGAAARLWQSERSLIGAVVALGAGSVVLLSLDPIIGILALFTAAPMIGRDWFIEAKRRLFDEAETLTYRKKYEVENALVAPRTGLRSRLWQLNNKYQSYFRELVAEVRNNALVIARFDRRWNLTIGLVEVAMLAVMCSYFASGLVEGSYTYLQLGAIGGSLSLLVTGMHRFGSSLTELENARRDYDYLARMLETKPLVDETHAQDIELSDTPVLKIENLTFSYPSTDIPVLENCSVEIASGEKVALVGRNGAGKTTLLRLIAKIYVPAGGSIWIDGHEIRSVRQQSWLNHLLMATQELELPGMELARSLTGSVSDNIDTDRMKRALVYSGADEIVAVLPQGMRTWIGEQWPSGRGFSTGQLQRLALAGAFYRFLDPKMFVGIFDEPMANCDVETRARFYQALGKAVEFSRKTILMSLHDPLYLHHFDRVLFIDGGRVAQDLRGQDAIASYRNHIAMALAGDL